MAGMVTKLRVFKPDSRAPTSQQISMKFLIQLGAGDVEGLIEGKAMISPLQQ